MFKLIRVLLPPSAWMELGITAAYWRYEDSRRDDRRAFAGGGASERTLRGRLGWAKPSEYTPSANKRRARPRGDGATLAQSTS